MRAEGCRVDDSVGGERFCAYFVYCGADDHRHVVGLPALSKPSHAIRRWRQQGRNNYRRLY